MKLYKKFLKNTTNYSKISSESNKLKLFITFIFRLNIKVSRLYLVGFKEKIGKDFHNLLKSFNLLLLKDEHFVPGFLTNIKKIKKSIKFKNYNLKFLVKNLRIKELPDLIFIYDTHPDTINLVKECQKLKIPVIILFDNHNIKESNVILTIFKGVNFDKNILFFIISNLLKSLLIKLIYIKKKLIEIEKKKNYYIKNVINIKNIKKILIIKEIIDILSIISINVSLLWYVLMHQSLKYLCCCKTIKSTL